MPAVTRTWTKTLLAGAGLAAVAALAAVGTTVVIDLARSDDTSAASTPTASTAAPATTPAELRVAALMADIACQGKVIETQLHSRETGRCELNGAEVTIATFASDALRDKWVSYAAEFGGNLVAGAGWAAFVDGPDAAKKVANLLDGQRV